MQPSLRRLLLSGLIIVAGCWGGLAAFAQTKKTKILVVGDSISAGYGLQRGTGWVSLLSAQLAKSHPNVSIVNASISGETAAGGSRRIKALLETHRPAIVIIELGANDGLRGYQTNAIAESLAIMIVASQDANAKVLLVGMDMPPNYGKTYATAFHKVYVDLAAQYRVAFLPSFFADLIDKPNLFQGDGLHPTEAAQPILKSAVWKTLSPMVSKPVASTPTRRAVVQKQQR